LPFSAYQKKLLTALGDFLPAESSCMSNNLGSCYSPLIVICILIFILIIMPYYDVAQRAVAIVLRVNGYTITQITEQSGILLDKAI
jgi:hypothetical protein